MGGLTNSAWVLGVLAGTDPATLAALLLSVGAVAVAVGVVALLLLLPLPPPSSSLSFSPPALSAAPCGWKLSHTECSNGEGGGGPPLLAAAAAAALPCLAASPPDPAAAAAAAGPCSIQRGLVGGGPPYAHRMSLRRVSSRGREETGPKGAAAGGGVPGVPGVGAGWLITSTTCT